MLIRTLPLLLLAAPASAAQVTIVTDIPPLAAIASAVIGSEGTVITLLPADASPHDFALRPSAALALQDADVIFWSGASLAPWMAKTLETLGNDAIQVEALASGGWEPLTVRELETLGDDDHVEDHGHDNASDHSDNALDPHAWLDPRIAGDWALNLADALTSAGLTSADVSLHAQTFAVEMDALQMALSAETAKLEGAKYLVGHDSFQYFEAAFNLPTEGAIALSDASAPGPAHIAALKEQVAGESVSCILTDAQTSSEFAELVAEGTDLRLASVNPMGNPNLIGSDYYRDLLGGIVATLADCTKSP